MTDTTPRAGAPLIAANQAQKNVTHNEALYQFDALMCARFLDRDLSTPPSSPVDGDTYLIKATGTGAWTGQDGKIAFWADGAWRFYAPFAGLVAYVMDESDLVVFNGSAWVDYGTLLALQNLPLLGVNTTADSTNKLSVKSNAALFSDLPTGSGGSGDIRVTLSKQAAANTATFLFQDNFSGRAEFGLAGDDNFHVKVSPDGSAWADALDIAAATGVVTIASGILTVADINGGTVDGANIGATTPGTGKFTTLQATGAVTLSPASAAVAISPTGTGTVAISPAGALTINPAAASTINNCAIGATTPSTGKFTTVATQGMTAQTGATVALLFGADSGLATLTDSTVKVGRIGAPHYLNAQAPAAGLFISSQSTATQLGLGGGSSIMNAATIIQFYAAATTTAGVGTVMGTVTSSGWALSPANASVVLSPTGSGTVTISPAGALTIAPTAASTINNCSVGVTAAAAGVFTTLQATTSLKLPAVANGAVATTMTSLGPTGSHTTVQEWFPVLNASGTTRYIPAY